MEAVLQALHTPATEALDPLAPENRADPYPYYRWLRENEPVRHAIDGSWIVTRYADGAALLRDPRVSTNPAWLRESSVRAELVRPPQEDLFR